MHFSITKVLNLIAFLCIAAVAFALFSQHVLDMNPCAWCVLQRLIFLVIAAICIILNLIPSILSKKIACVICAVLSISGAYSAWYQTFIAAKLITCDMTLADIFMARTTHLDSAIPWLFGIYATCMDARVTLLGIEYSLWALGLFVVLALLSIYGLFKKASSYNSPKK